MKSTVCWPICYTNTHEQFTESTTLLKDAVCEELHFSTCFYCVDVQVRALLYRDTSRRLHQWKASLVNVCNDFVFYINSIECQDFKSLSSCWFYSHCMFMFSSVWSRLQRKEIIIFIYERCKKCCFFLLSFFCVLQGIFMYRNYTICLFSGDDSFLEKKKKRCLIINHF